MAEVFESIAALEDHEVTPMMKQYLEIKDQYCDYFLFYRLGDFYELFFEDAVLASRELELTLTGRDCGGGRRATMCGVPFHKADVYIGRLVDKGYKVAVCEQTEDPSEAKGLVRREVIRVVTPGTVTDDTLLTGERNNYLAAIYYSREGIGVAFCDVSTGEINVTSLTGADLTSRLRNELGSYQPSEVILNVKRAAAGEIVSYLTESFETLVTPDRTSLFEYSACREGLVATYGEDILLSFTDDIEISAAGAILSYVIETQKCATAYLKKIHIYRDGEYMEIDNSTRRNLELTETMRNKEKKGSLLWILDRTATSMGARMLRNWLTRPLVSPAAISHRQSSVRSFYDDLPAREEVREILSRVYDIERLTAKAVYGKANAKDLRALALSLVPLPELFSYLSRFSAPRLAEIYSSADRMTELAQLLSEAIADDPPFSIREGGMIRAGYNSDVDYLRSIRDNGADWIRRVEEEERLATGIKNLRVSYNKVFGYYIEVTNSMLSQVPERYIRKQTLTNCERYITQELKDIEATILGAADKLSALEFSLFNEVREAVVAAAERLQATAAFVAEIDVYQSLAEVAVKNRYVCPEMDMSQDIVIKDGRHPVVERYVKDSFFVPNDVELNNGANRLMLITGPNMAGKSTYMRQVCLTVIMAQIGSFVPAREARIGIVDKVFTRVGASDDLAAGQSTFMLEMSEVAFILKNATSRSLIIYDEVGRGTSTYDGMSIARAVIEYTLSKKVGAKTLFATHYHELTVMENEFDGVVNYNIAAKKRGDSIVFLRKIVRGATDDSYGIEVAKLAGVPQEVVRRAREILKEIDDGEHKAVFASDRPAVPVEEDLFTALVHKENEEVIEKIRNLDLNTITPIEALSFLFDLKKRLGTGDR